MAHHSSNHYFITGASSGIGAALVKKLCAEGNRVSGVARREDRLAALATAINTPAATTSTQPDHAATDTDTTSTKKATDTHPDQAGNSTPATTINAPAKDSPAPAQNSALPPAQNNPNATDPTPPAKHTPTPPAKAASTLPAQARNSTPATTINAPAKDSPAPAQNSTNAVDPTPPAEHNPTPPAETATSAADPADHTPSPPHRTPPPSPQFTPITADVTDSASIRRATARAIAENGAIDTAILNAGIYTPLDASKPDTAIFRQHIEVNYMGVVHCLNEIIPPMVERGKGRIVIVASVAGWRGLPRAAAYSPSKSALISLAASLRFDLEPKGVIIQVVSPGFVETEATAVNDFAMPQLLSAAAAAEAICAGMRSRRFEIAFPQPFALMMRILSIMPWRWYFWLVGKQMGKPK